MYEVKVRRLATVRIYEYRESLLCLLSFFFFLMIRRPPRSTLFPYTRSSDLEGLAVVELAAHGVGLW